MSTLCIFNMIGMNASGTFFISKCVRLALVIGYAFIFRSVENRIWISVKPRSKYNTYLLHFTSYIILFYSMPYFLPNNNSFVKKNNIQT